MILNIPHQEQLKWLPCVGFRAVSQMLEGRFMEFKKHYLWYQNTGEWLNKSGYIHSVKYYAATKRNDVYSVSDMQGCPWYIMELNRQVMVHGLSHFFFFQVKRKKISKHTRCGKKKNPGTIYEKFNRGYLWELKM